MFEQIMDQYENIRGQVRERGASDQLNESNAGIIGTESAVAFVAGLGATWVARELLEAAWRTMLDREPPKNPSSRKVEWKEALIWGSASGALVGIAGIATRRLSRAAVRRLRS